MTLRPVHLVSRCGARVAAAALSLLVMTGSARPQGPSPQQQPPLGLQEQQPAASPPPSPENPGLIHEMGKLIDRIVPGMKSPGETLGEFNARAREAASRAAKEAAKSAGDALSRLAKPGPIASGRTKCVLAANSTPDCKLAADKLCQTKGYKEGKSLNTDSAKSCPAKVLIPGRQRKPDDCRTDTYVTTALCQ